MDDHKSIQELRKEWDGLKKDPALLGKFLSERSGLPGRTNMELAEETAELASNLKDARRYVDRWMMSGDEYLGVVAVLLLGRLMEHSADENEAGIPIMEYAVINKRWRLREAVAHALRHMARSDPGAACGILEQWVTGGYPIMYTVALETLGDVDLLRKKPGIVKNLRGMSVKAMSEVSFHPNETGEPMRLLRETLGRTTTVLAMHDVEAMGLMREWAKSPPLRPILKASISDRKLRKKYPDESADLLDYIETGGI